MATKRGPTKGGRVLVQLPFGRNTPPKGKAKGVSTLVKVKQGIAELLKLKPVKAIPTAKVTFKTAAGSKTVTRVRGVGSYRQQSITLIFAKPQAIKGSQGTYKTVGLPLGSGCTITDAVVYFQKNFPNIIGIRTQSGNRIQWGIAGTGK